TQSTHSSKEQLTFTPIKSTNELNQSLSSAKKQGKIAMLDFYADWCVSCKEMDSITFNNPKVQNVLKRLTPLRADVTASNASNNKALLNRFNVVAPPTILFFDKNGKELTKYRIVGEMKPEKFLAHFDAVNILVSQAYQVDENGMVWGFVDPDVLKLSLKHSVKLMPLITNVGFDKTKAHKFLTNSVAQERALHFILSACQQYHYY